MTGETIATVAAAADEAFLEVDAVVKHFPAPGGGWRRGRVRSVDGVSLAVAPGEVLGLVGESGCGKSTLSRLITRLLKPDSGTVTIGGRDLATLRGEALRRFRRSVQLIFQDPFGALDPLMRIGTSLEQPLAQHGIGPAGERRTRMARMLAEVGLDMTFAERLPGQCSGGQLQRLVIARALLLEPRLLVCDEPTSALDAPLRAQIINLLLALKDRFDLTLLVISHDLRVVRHISDRVAVMYLGRIVESGPREALFADPRHPYTRALIAASLLEEHDLQWSGAAGEPPSPIDPPPGCAYHPRCALADERCAREAPLLTDVGTGHRVACHYRDAASAGASERTCHGERG